MIAYTRRRGGRRRLRRRCATTSTTASSCAWPASSTWPPCSRSRRRCSPSSRAGTRRDRPELSAPFSTRPASAPSRRRVARRLPRLSDRGGRAEHHPRARDHGPRHDGDGSRVPRRRALARLVRRRSSARTRVVEREHAVEQRDLEDPADVGPGHDETHLPVQLAQPLQAAEQDAEDVESMNVVSERSTHHVDAPPSMTAPQPVPELRRGVQVGLTVHDSTTTRREGDSSSMRKSRAVRARRVAHSNTWRCRFPSDAPAQTARVASLCWPPMSAYELELTSAAHRTSSPRSRASST